MKDVLLGLMEAFWTTLKEMFRKPVTIEYPERRRPLPERARWRIVLTKDPDGEERCVACYLCSAVCPVSCISMQSIERETDGRRMASWFRINFSRCILCGMCEEACPTYAIQLTPDYEFCKYDVLDMVYEKEDLLVDGQGKYPGYNFYRHSGVGVVNQKGQNPDEYGPVDIRGNMP